MIDNKKPMARVPIVPSNFANKDLHKLHELVLDYTNNDIYVKDTDGYVNLTGRIRDSVQYAIENGITIEVVTEDTLPQISDRKRNCWYLVIQESERIDGDDTTKVVIESYIYYGLIDKNFNIHKKYSLISQNVITSSDTHTIKFLVEDGLTPCFYVPSNVNISCKYSGTNTQAETTALDNIFIFSPQDGTYSEYRIMALNDINAEIVNGKRYITIDVSATTANESLISFESTADNIGFKEITPLAVVNNNYIMSLPVPEWTDKRYSFKGWSLKKSVFDKIDIGDYLVTRNITLYAWFDYNERTRNATVSIRSVVGG